MMSGEMWLGVISLVISTVSSVGLFFVGIQLSKIRDLKKQLHDAAAAIIDARFVSHTAQITGAIEMINMVVREVKQRVQDGDDELDHYSDERQKLELKTQTQIASLKEWVMTNCSTRSDFEKLEQRMTGLMNQVGRSLARYPQREE